MEIIFVAVALGFLALTVTIITNVLEEREDEECDCESTNAE